MRVQRVGWGGGGGAESCIALCNPIFLRSGVGANFYFFASRVQIGIIASSSDWVFTRWVRVTQYFIKESPGFFFI